MHDIELFVSYSHAALVQQAFADADNEAFLNNEDGSELGYYAARRKAEELEGVVIFNANRDTSTTYLYPSVIYEFNDNSFCEVSYGYAQALTQVEAESIIALNTNQ